MKNKTKIIFLISLIVVIVGLLFVLLIINQHSRTPKTTVTLSPSVTKNPSTSTIDVTVTPVAITTKQPTLTIIWSKANIFNPEKNYPLYTSQKLLSNKLADLISNRLGFTSSVKKSLGEGNYIWKTTDNQQILLYTPKEEALMYQNLQPTQPKNNFDDTNIQNQSLGLLKSLLPEYTFRVASITYFKDDYYSIPTTANNGEIAQVFLDQTINNFPIIPSNLGNSHTIILYLNQDLSIKTLSISNGYLQTATTSSTASFDLKKLQSLPISSFINLTPLRLDKQSQFNQGSKAQYTVSKIEPAYILIQDTLSPVYLMSGQIKVDNLAPFSDNVQYIAPLN